MFQKTFVWWPKDINDYINFQQSTTLFALKVQYHIPIKLKHHEQFA
jgi:hypothetical protein